MVWSPGFVTYYATWQRHVPKPLVPLAKEEVSNGCLQVPIDDCEGGEIECRVREDQHPDASRHRVDRPENQPHDRRVRGARPVRIRGAPLRPHHRLFCCTLSPE